MLKRLMLALAVACIALSAVPRGAFAETSARASSTRKSPAKPSLEKAKVLVKVKAVPARTTRNRTPVSVARGRPTRARTLSRFAASRPAEFRTTLAAASAFRMASPDTASDQPPGVVPCQPFTARQPITCQPATVRPADQYFTTSDSVRLHYLEAGSPTRPTIIFVPGWTMPAWIWMPQIAALSHDYHVIAFDPRGQGSSDVPEAGYEPSRRGRDIRELIQHLGASDVTIVGWSLGVLDTLAMIHTTGDHDVDSLVLVDNSVGEEPAPIPSPRPAHSPPLANHATGMERFVISMFHRRQSQDYLDRLTEATLRTPEYAAHLLLSYPVPRSYWRDAIYATHVPVLYVIRPLWLAQGENLLHNRPDTELDVFSDTGHALFVDDSPRFNADLVRFLRQKVWP
jgi:non-heme chloroperoxidase